MTNQKNVSMGIRLFNSYREEVNRNKDCFEKAGEICIFYLHTVAGKKILLHKDQPCEIKTAHLALRIFCALSFVVTAPLTLVGVLLISLSKTHKKAHEEALKSLQIDNKKVEDEASKEENNQEIKDKQRGDKEKSQKNNQPTADKKPSDQKKDSKQEHPKKDLSLINYNEPTTEDLRDLRLEKFQNEFKNKELSTNTQTVPHTTTKQEKASANNKIAPNSKEIHAALQPILTQLLDIKNDVFFRIKKIENEITTDLKNKKQNIGQNIEVQLQEAQLFAEQTKKADEEFRIKIEPLKKETILNIEKLLKENHEKIQKYTSVTYLTSCNESIEQIKALFSKASLKIALEAKAEVELLQKKKAEAEPPLKEAQTKDKGLKNPPVNESKKENPLNANQKPQEKNPGSTQNQAAKPMGQPKKEAPKEIEFPKCNTVDMRQFIENNNSQKVPLLFHYLNNYGPFFDQSSKEDQMNGKLTELKKKKLAVINLLEAMQNPIIPIFKEMKFDPDDAISLAVKHDRTKDFVILTKMLAHANKQFGKQDAFKAFGKEYISLVNPNEKDFDGKSVIEKLKTFFNIKDEVPKEIQFPALNTTDIEAFLAQTIDDKLKVELLFHYLKNHGPFIDPDGTDRSPEAKNIRLKTIAVLHLISRLDAKKISIFNELKFDPNDAISLAIKCDRTQGFLILNRLIHIKNKSLKDSESPLVDFNEYINLVSPEEKDHKNRQVRPRLLKFLKLNEINIEENKASENPPVQRKPKEKPPVVQVNQANNIEGKPKNEAAKEIQFPSCDLEEMKAFLKDDEANNLKVPLLLHYLKTPGPILDVVKNEKSIRKLVILELIAIIEKNNIRILNEIKYDPNDVISLAVKYDRTKNFEILSKLIAVCEKQLISRVKFKDYGKSYIELIKKNETHVIKQMKAFFKIEDEVDIF